MEASVNVNKVRTALLKVHEEIQEDIGPSSGAITSSTCPLKDLKGFDSILVPVAIRMAAKKLGVKIPKDTKIENLYVSSDGGMKLKIDEIAPRVAQFLSFLEVPKA